MIALLHVHRVECTIIGFALRPCNLQPATLVVGNVNDGRPLNWFGSFVVVEFTRGDDRAHHGYIRQVLLTCFVDAGEANPNRYARGLFDDRLISFVGGVGRERRSSKRIRHRGG